MRKIRVALALLVCAFSVHSVSAEQVTLTSISPDGPIIPMWPEISPDGRFVAFFGMTRFSFTKGGMFVMRNDGKELRRMTTIDGENNWELHLDDVWSPDSSHVLVRRYARSPNGGLSSVEYATIDIETQEFKPFTKTDPYNHAYWKPGGDLEIAMRKWGEPPAEPKYRYRAHRTNIEDGETTGESDYGYEGGPFFTEVVQEISGDDISIRGKLWRVDDNGGKLYQISGDWVRGVSISPDYATGFVYDDNRYIRLIHKDHEEPLWSGRLPNVVVQEGGWSDDGRFFAFNTAVDNGDGSVTFIQMWVAEVNDEEGE